MSVMEYVRRIVLEPLSERPTGEPCALYDCLMRTRGGLALVAVIVLGLTGCVQATPERSPAPTKSAESTPVAPVKPTAPVNSYGLNCANLVPQEIVESSIAAGVKSVPPFTHRSDDNPRVWAVSSLGGMDCWWSNGADLDEWNSGSDRSARWATLTALPEAHAEWDSFVERTAPLDDSIPGLTELVCYASSEFGSSTCSINMLLGDSWAYLLISGAGDDQLSSDEDTRTAAQPFVDAIRAAFATAGTAPRYGWEGTVPGDGPLPASCAEYVPDAELSDILGRELTYSSAPKKKLWPRGVANDDFGVADCIFADPGSDNSVGDMSVLPGGRWAYERLVEARTLARAAIEPVNVDGLAAGSAFVECRELPARSCTVNVAVAGHWMAVNVSNPSSVENDATADDLGQRAIAYAKRAASSLLG